MDLIKTLASSGPSGEPMATPSTCSCSCPLNWNSWSLVDAFRRFTRSILRRFNWCVSFNQLYVNALLASICMVSSRDTLVKSE